MHMIFISPTFYKNKIKNVHENPVSQENVCGVFSSMVTYFFLSMYYIRLKFTHRYYFAV